MKITQLLQEDKVTLSLEVFPPKKDTDFENVKQKDDKGDGNAVPDSKF